MKQKLTLTQLFTLAFVIFAIFFGAGNLIFPPIVGFQAGENALIAVIGFLITAVGLPTVSLIAFATIEGNLNMITDKVSPKFTFIYSCAVYLLMGPLFVVPRTAIVANEMAIVPFVPETLASDSTVLLAFSFTYFLIIYLFCIYSTKIVDVVGKYIVPLLLVTVSLLIIGAMVWPLASAGDPIGNFYHSPFTTGMIDGFLTMDSLSTIIIVMIVMANLKELGITDSSTMVSYTIKAGLIAGISLSLVYGGLAYIGVTSNVPFGTTNGGVILVNSAESSFGFIGMVLLAIVVLAACFTTALTLILGFAKFFHQSFPAISYKNFVRIAVLFSFGISNLGFDVLMALTVPVLDIVYPVAIVIVAFTFLRNHINSTTSKVGIIVCLIFGVSYVLYNTFGFNLEFLTVLPLFKEGLGWILPTTIAVAISALVTKNQPVQVQKNETEQ